MVSATGAAIPASIVFPAPRSTSNSSSSIDSFAQQLAHALEGYIQHAPGGSPIEIDIEPAASQDSGARQFVVTVKTPTGSAAAAASAPTTVTPATPAIPATPAAPSKPIQTEADAYWALQPQEVQALRGIQEPELRAGKAKELMGRGFKVDPQIMVWGWDPLKTMTARKMMGYTWVPSFGQPSVQVPPGLSFPGKPTYDPFNAPAGSIEVSTSFADGLGITDPWA